MIENTFTAAIIILLLALMGNLASVIVEPAGFKVTCNETSFSMPAGTMAHAVNASKGCTGCTSEKMKF